jgi:hypothetical protein
MTLSIGETVKIKGLVNSYQYNGKMGIVVSAVDAKTNRCGVRISAGINDVSKVVLLQFPDHRKGDNASLLTSGGKEAVCYLCLSGEIDEPLRRDCSCRGTDAGFVHLSCLAQYATCKSNAQTSGEEEFVKPWRECPNCHQAYKNELRLDIANDSIQTIHHCRSMLFI